MNLNFLSYGLFVSKSVSLKDYQEKQVFFVISWYCPHAQFSTIPNNAENWKFLVCAQLDQWTMLSPVELIWNESTHKIQGNGSSKPPQPLFSLEKWHELESTDYRRHHQQTLIMQIPGFPQVCFKMLSQKHLTSHQWNQNQFWVHTAIPWET